MTLDGERVYLGVYRTEMEAWAAIEAASQMARPASTQGITLGAWGEKWLRQREVDGYRDVRNERSRWGKYIEGHRIADMTLRNIKRKHILNWLRDVMQQEATGVMTYRTGIKVVGRGRNISRSTAMRVLNIMRCMHRDAADADLVPSNPSSDVRVPK